MTRYLLERKIGEGAMGQVFVAADTVIDRKVAIKVLPISTNIGSDATLDGKSDTKTLLAEAKAAGRVVHPHVVTIFDVTEIDGRLAIVMEYVQGDSLRTFIQNRHGIHRQAIAIATNMLSGLAAIHQAGIVHRDMKPENVMLAGGELPKIMDFGIARLLDSTKTMTLGLQGTPRYISPEQVLGEFADFRSDIFSAGCIAYELFSGKKAFGQNARALPEILWEIAHFEPVRLDSADTSIPGRLANVVHKALAKNPSDRYQSAAEMQNDLMAATSGLDDGTLSATSLLCQKTLVKQQDKPSVSSKVSSLLDDIDAFSRNFDEGKFHSDESSEHSIARKRSSFSSIQFLDEIATPDTGSDPVRTAPWHSDQREGNSLQKESVTTSLLKELEIQSDDPEACPAPTHNSRREIVSIPDPEAIQRCLQAIHGYVLNLTHHLNRVRRSYERAYTNELLGVIMGVKWLSGSIATDSTFFRDHSRINKIVLNAKLGNGKVRTIDIPTKSVPDFQKECEKHSFEIKHVKDLLDVRGKIVCQRVDIEHIFKSSMLIFADYRSGRAEAIFNNFGDFGTTKISLEICEPTEDYLDNIGKHILGISHSPVS